MDDESTQVLNFAAKLISDYPEDRRRQFMVSYFLCDKTMAIYEKQVPNSGFRAGKFLQRTRVRNPETKAFFEPSAFYVGARIHVSGRIFELFDAAPHTFCLMEAHSEDFPDADLPKIVENLKQVCLNQTRDLRALFEAKDPRKDGYCSADEAKSVLEQFGSSISQHAIQTILRGFTTGSRFDYSTILKYIKA